MASLTPLRTDTPLARALAEFNEVFGGYTTPTPTTDIPEAVYNLRVRLVTEEHRELIEAIDERDLPHIAKEAADLAYVLRGTTDAYGFDLDAAPISRYPGPTYVPVRPSVDVPPAILDTTIARIDGTFDRLITAMSHTDLDAIATAAADLLIAVDRLASAYGFNLSDAVSEVHASNMTKVGPDGKAITDAGGKVRKGPNYREADMARALNLPA